MFEMPVIQVGSFIRSVVADGLVGHRCDRRAMVRLLLLLRHQPGVGSSGSYQFSVVARLDQTSVIKAPRFDQR